MKEKKRYRIFWGYHEDNPTKENGPDYYMIAEKGIGDLWYATYFHMNGGRFN